jgi:hypothetical protein
MPTLFPLCSAEKTSAKVGGSDIQGGKAA